MTDRWAIGGDAGTMLTGMSAVTAAYVWTRSQVRGWKAERAERSYRNWHGFIMMGSIDSRYVRLVDDPGTPQARVVLDVVDRRGEPNPEGARTMRLRAGEDGLLARVPTPQEYDFLKDLHKRAGLRQEDSNHLNHLKAVNRQMRYVLHRSAR